MALPIAIKNGLDTIWDRIQSNNITRREYIRVTVGGNDYKIKILKEDNPEITDAAKYVIKIYPD
jgi:hypothetical protein